MPAVHLKKRDVETGMDYSSHAIISQIQWEFDGEQGMQHKLKLIVHFVISPGLDWFEEQIGGIKAT